MSLITGKGKSDVLGKGEANLGEALRTIHNGVPISIENVLDSSYTTSEAQDIIIRISPQKKLEVSKFLDETESICIDLGCGDTYVGKTLRRYFGIKQYVGVDQFDSGNIAIGDQFIHGDMLLLLSHIPDNSVPFLMANNLDFCILPKPFKYDGRKIDYSRDLVPEIIRVVKPGGFITSLGVTLDFERPGLESLVELGGHRGLGGISNTLMWRKSLT